MEIKWNTNHIDLQELIKISRGDKAKVARYLKQFQKLIPPRIENLKSSVRAKDRIMTRQIVHKMGPQLQFFGIPGIAASIRQVEHGYETMPFKELESLVRNILVKLDRATREVDSIIKRHF